MSKAKLSMIPIEALEACAAAFEDGAKKYGRNSFKEMNNALWSDCIDAMLRHANQFNAGIDLTEDSKISHLAGVMARAAMLIYWQKHKIGIDDRLLIGATKNSENLKNIMDSIEEIG